MSNQTYPCELYQPIILHDVRPADPLPQRPQYVNYEMALNENMRIALRLEHLFRHFQSYLSMAELSRVDARSAVQSLLATLELIRRPDLKTKLLQSLSLQVTKLLSIKDHAQCDHLVLQQLVDNLHRCAEYIHAIPGRIGDALYHNEFLSALNLQLNAVGRGASENMPAFVCWLHSPAAKLRQDLRTWFEHCLQLPAVIEQLLMAVRLNYTEQQITCKQGFYTQQLSLGQQYQLLRLQLAQSVSVYPEVSVGKHRISMRLVTADMTTSGKAAQFDQQLDFHMMLCSA